LLETKSQFRDGPVEGVYLRYEGAPDHRRCKLVRPDFVQGITSHWMTGEQVKNTVNLSFKLDYNCYTMAVPANSSGRGGGGGGGGGDDEGEGRRAAASAPSFPADDASAACTTHRFDDTLATINPRERFVVEFADARPPVTLPRNTSFVRASLHCSPASLLVYRVWLGFSIYSQS
jgi:hypothetical protein